ncbi:MAG: tryptophan synthase subunit alpha [Phycisphaeraceae bacterium]|nr:tryptophan synthase subunit alpha [Phycisphaeraceae bacterium]
MGRIDAIFDELRGTNRKALMPFVCAGHPRLDSLPDILLSLQNAGASIVEVGIPYSDPIADGPIIAAAMHRAIQAGCTPRTVLEQIASVRERLRMGLVAMVSISIMEKLASSADPAAVVGQFRDSGFDGFIFPDLPLEESEAWRAAAASAQLSCTFLIAPSTAPERAVRIAQASTGFVYLLARAGITGERTEMPDLSGRISELRRVSKLPIAVGFGISTPEHVRHVVQSADAAIVGSALVRRLSETGPDQSPAQVAGDFCRQLSAGLS